MKSEDRPAHVSNVLTRLKSSNRVVPFGEGGGIAVVVSATVFSQTGCVTGMWPGITIRSVLV